VKTAQHIRNLGIRQIWVASVMLCHFNPW